VADLLQALDAVEPAADRQDVIDVDVLPGQALAEHASLPQEAG
jgi:hypothetical protein